jgi:flavin reductase (DIM6/NTAB) family NADH-FMN oxidoreductase RutF
VSIASVSALWSRLDPVIWVVTARAASRRGGLIATFVSQASIVPETPRVLVGLARQHYTWELVEASGAFALHLLDEEHVDWVWRFGLHSGREADKMEGLNFRDGATGSPILTDALGWLECRVEARLDTGDRTIYLAEVIDGEQIRSGSVLSLQRLRQIAPQDKLQELRKLMDRDSAVDGEAIRTWRQNRPPSVSPPEPGGRHRGGR